MADRDMYTTSGFREKPDLNGDMVTRKMMDAKVEVTLKSQPRPAWDVLLGVDMIGHIVESYEHNGIFLVYDRDGSNIGFAVGEVEAVDKLLVSMKARPPL